jgi:hypothetical protein
MKTATKGNIAEAAVLHALVSRDLHVLTPFGSGHPYDLVVEAEGCFVRVQVKTGWPLGGCVVFNSHSTDHGQGRGSYHGLADVFGVYFPPTGAVYIVPVTAVTATEGRLRLEPTKNNQKRRVRLAVDYEIARWGGPELAAVVNQPATAA